MRATRRASASSPGRYVLPVCPPPDLDVEAWFRTFDEIERRQPARLALIHFGVADSPSEHLVLVRQELTRWAERGREAPDEQAWVEAADATSRQRSARTRPTTGSGRRRCGSPTSG